MDLFANDIEKIRQDYIRFLADVVEFSNEAGSTFNGLRKQDKDLDDLLNKCVKDKDNVRMQRPCNGQFSCMLIGTSSAGKTTFLRELFPDLNDKGWLETDSNATTSHGMVIEYSEYVKDVEIDSYAYEDLKHFFELTEDAAKDGRVYYTYDDANRTIHVNAEDIVFGTAQSEEVNGFRFNKTFDLKPFLNFSRNGNNSSDVMSLITMEASTSENEETGNNPLQMRALVKSIRLSSDYRHAADLLKSEEDKDIIRHIKFIDTPGLGTDRIMSRDEALFYTLFEKPRFIVEQFCRDDDVDVMVCQYNLGEQARNKLWDNFRPYKDKNGNDRGVPQEILSELEQNLILQINRTTQFVSCPDIKRRIEQRSADELDHIAIYIKRNILDLLLGDNKLPSAICFIECLPAAKDCNLNTPEGREKASQYCNETLCGMKENMESWTHKDHGAYNSMLELNLISETNGEPFLSNVEHLCIKDDRGQGFFLETLVDMIKTRGPEMLFRKHLVRSKLQEDIQNIRSYLNSRYNSENGSLFNAAFEQSNEGAGEAVVNFVQTNDDKNKVVSLFAQLNSIETSISRLEKQI